MFRPSWPSSGQVKNGDLYTASYVCMWSHDQEAQVFTCTGVSHDTENNYKAKNYVLYENISFHELKNIYGNVHYGLDV